MPSFRNITLFSVAVLCGGLTGCKHEAVSPAPPIDHRPIGTPISIHAPLGLPPVPIPADNPPTAETVALGRKLYYDPILSVDGTVSCSTCHSPKNGFCDGRAVSVGVHGQLGTRNAPTVLNAAYFTTQFWDGRADSLEQQSGGPMANPIEMGHTLAGVEKKLNADPAYRAAFKEAFGADTISIDMVEKSLATFERTLLSGNSPFDRYQYAGDNQALSDSAKRGLEVFRNPKKGNCAVCHTIGDNDALFTDNKFHNLGVGVKLSLDGEAELLDIGRFKVTGVEKDKGAFRTPSLRNIALTAPYMHDGSDKTLKQTIDFYIGAGNSNPYRDKEIHSLDFLTGRERADLLEFLKSLTGEMPPNSGPPTT
jgi:cytochrome c peroxidase